MFDINVKEVREHLQEEAVKANLPPECDRPLSEIGTSVDLPISHASEGDA